MKAVLAALSFTLCLLAPAQALAWKSQGHRVVAEIAWAAMTPAARAETERLLADEPPAKPGEPALALARAATWADQLRDTDPEFGKRSAAWHYVNFADATCRFDPARDCKGRDCVIAAINRDYLVLKQRGRSDAERREALKFLAHFVGDIHQPLHAGGADDRGGTQYQVQFGGRGEHLHALWDDEVLRADLAPGAYAAELAARAPLPADPTLRSPTLVLDWAVESCRIVHAPGFYPTSRKVGADYVEAQRPVAERRLREAGARLAFLLNDAFRAPPAAR